MSYDFRSGAGETVYRTTAGVLARILYKTDGAGLSRGHYPGTEIPMRRVPDSAPVELVVRRGGGLVKDRDGGWIADRFGPGIGQRDAQRAAAELERLGVSPE